MPNATQPENLEQALTALSALHPKKIDLGLDRILRVLKRLGNPHLKLPPSVHIAGTNGKGSTIAMLRAMAEAEGLKVHVYTSPHLVRFNERIVLAGEEIEDAYLVDVIARVRAANDGAPLSFFEATTAAMFLTFSETPADLAIIEVGLGGRYDATNVFDPALCGISPVDYDHAEFLGRDLAGIAREKAGIIKRHAPVYIGVQPDIARAILDNEAQKNRAPAQFQDQDFRSYREHGRLVFEAQDALLDLPPPALFGEHQIKNAGLSIALARHLQISEPAIKKGLKTAYWPARLQPLTKGPLADMVAKAGGELWLDGGHNPHAARAIASAMATRDDAQARPLILVTGILANKDIGGFLDAFEGLASALIGVGIQDHASLAPETLIEIAQGRGLVSTVADNLSDAVQRAIELGEKLKTTPPRILICGSLYLAGQVLKDNS